MKSPITTSLFFLLATLGATPAAHALFHYQFEFGAVTTPYNGKTYAADSFEFTTNTLLLNVGDSATVTPAHDLNGYSVTQATVNQRDVAANAITFTPDGNAFASPIGAPAGAVFSYFFALDNYTGGTGIFATTGGAGRGINDFGGVFAYTSGKLTITDQGAGVPEPGTLALMALGLLGFARRRRAR